MDPNSLAKAKQVLLNNVRNLSSNRLYNGAGEAWAVINPLDGTQTIPPAALAESLFLKHGDFASWYCFWLAKSRAYATRRISGINQLRDVVQNLESNHEACCLIAGQLPASFTDADNKLFNNLRDKLVKKSDAHSRQSKRHREYMINPTPK
jgi:hypothetical protein